MAKLKVSSSTLLYWLAVLVLAIWGYSNLEFSDRLNEMLYFVLIGSVAGIGVIVDKHINKMFNK